MATKSYDWTGLATAGTPKSILVHPNFPPEWPFSEEDLRREDETDDSLFYDQPRLVHHIDDKARVALQNFYEKTLMNEKTVDVLDICR